MATSRMSVVKIGKSIANMFSNDKKSSVQQATQAAAELEAAQEAKRETLKLSKTARVGYPFRPTCMAYDMVQHVLAIGTQNGYVKLYGGESIEYTLFHVSTSSSSSSSMSSKSNNNNNNNSNINENSSSSSQMQQQQQQQSSSSAALNQTNNPNSSSNLTSSNNVTIGSALSGAGGGSQPKFSPSSGPAAVMFMSFLINQGALITYCEDSVLSLWTLRQKQPCLSFSRKLVNEKATAMLLPFQSNWVYLGTEKGNIYVLNVYNNFSQSGYDIKWNNVIELSQKNKPGRVIHLSDHPQDSGKLLIGYDSGLIVLWNIKLKQGEQRFYGTSEMMSSISWFYDAKQFMSSHNNGSLIVWNCRSDRPIEIMRPHMSDKDLIPQYNMIRKVSWEANGRGEPLVIFSDGLPIADTNMKDAITIIQNNKLKTIIEMKSRIVDFTLVYSSPYISDSPSDPSAMIVLLEDDLVTYDLKTDGFPKFQHQHAINMHDPPITICDYIVDPNWQLFQSLLSSKEKQLQQQQQQQQAATSQQSSSNNNNNNNGSKQNYSTLPYPISGGIKCSKSNVFPYNELIVTGHEDGSVKLWDASGMGSVLIHKIKTHKLFDKRRADLNNDLEFPYKIISINVNNFYLAVAAACGHVILYKYYSKVADEELADIPLLEVPMNYEQNSPAEGGKQANESSQTTGGDNATAGGGSCGKKELKSYLKTKIGFRKQQGYQPELVCLLSFNQRIPVVNSIQINPKNSTLLFGTDEAFVCVDYATRIVLFNVAISNLYSNQELSHRQKSPKKGNKTIVGVSSDMDDLNLNESHNSHYLAKQFTIESSFHQQNLRDTLSQNSSNSSSEYLVLSEGISFLAINDGAQPLQPNKLNPELQHYSSQLWLGTNYGTVIVLNAASLVSSNSNANNNNNSVGECSSCQTNLSNSENNLKPTTISQTGIVHTLKGQILHIAFLDTDGNVCTGGCPAAATAAATVTKDKHKLTANASLAIDFNYMPSASMISNSIADNFYGSTSPSSLNNSNNNNSDKVANANFSNTGSTGNTDGSGSSPTTEKALANSILPAADSKFEELKGPQQPLSKIKKPLSIARSSKTDMNAITELPDRGQFVVLCSESEIKVLAIPSQTVLHKHQITDGNLVKASVVTINSLAYLTCYNSNGNFQVFNLINLKQNLNANLVQVANIKEKETYDKINKTFTIASKGHSMFMCTPTEIQKCYLSTSNGFSNLTEMLPELFDPRIVTPQPPKTGILKSIFSNTPFNREELFGEASGKPSTNIIKNLDSDAAKVNKEMSELVKLGIQRGEKLSELQLKTEAMTEAARNYANSAHELANKYKKSSKWF